MRNSTQPRRERNVVNDVRSTFVHFIVTETGVRSSAMCNCAFYVHNSNNMSNRTVREIERKYDSFWLVGTSGVSIKVHWMFACNFAIPVGMRIRNIPQGPKASYSQILYRVLALIRKSAHFCMLELALSYEAKHLKAFLHLSIPKCWMIRIISIFYTSSFDTCIF